jgi:hypothetical protein
VGGANGAAGGRSLTERSPLVQGTLDLLIMRTMSTPPPPAPGTIAWVELTFAVIRDPAGAVAALTQAANAN